MPSRHGTVQILTSLQSVDLDSVACRVATTIQSSTNIRHYYIFCNLQECFQNVQCVLPSGKKRKAFSLYMFDSAVALNPHSFDRKLLAY